MFFSHYKIGDSHHLFSILFLGAQNAVAPEAELELKSFLLNCNDLPYFYAEDLAILANKIRKINSFKIKGVITKSEIDELLGSQVSDFLEANFGHYQKISASGEILNSRASEYLSNRVNNSNNTSNSTSLESEIVNLIMEDNLDRVVELLLEKLENIKGIEVEVYSFIAWIKEINNFLKSRIISFNDYFFFYKKYMESIFILLKRVDLENNKINSRTWLLKELLLNSTNTTIIIPLVREIISFESNTFEDIEETLYLLKMLEDRFHNIITNKTKSMNFEQKNIEENRIRRAFFYISSSIKNKSNENNISLEYNINRFSLASKLNSTQMKRFFLEGDLVSALEILHHDAIYLSQLYEQINEHKKRGWMATVTTFKWIEKKERYIYDFYNYLFGNKDSSLDEPNSSEKRSKKKSLMLIRELLSHGHLEDAIDQLLNLNTGQKIKNLILFKKQDFLRVKEDDLFTDKDKELIFSRKTKIAIKLFEIIGELESVYSKGKAISIILPFKELKALIRENEIPEALNILGQSKLNLDFNNEVCVAKFLFNISNREYQTGNIDNMVFHTRRNFVAEKIISIIDRIENQY